MPMTPEERGQLRADVVKAVNETLVEQQRELRDHTWPDEETRTAHHRYIAKWIDQQEAKQQNLQRLKGNFIVGAALAVFSAIGYAGLWLWEHAVRASG